MRNRPSGAIARAAALAVPIELLVEMESFEHELGRRREEAGTLDRSHQTRDRLRETGDRPETLLVFVGAHAVGHLDAPARLEMSMDALAPLEGQVLVPDLQHGAIDQPLDQIALALLLATVLELDLADGRRAHRRQVRQPRYDLLLARPERALLGVRDERLVVVDGDADA